MEKITEKKLLIKKYLPFLLLLSCLFGNAEKTHGQAALFVLLFGDKIASEKFHLSLDIGLNVSTLDGYPKQNVFLSPNFGLGTHLKINEKWSFAPEFKALAPRGVRDVKNPVSIPDGIVVSSSNSDLKLGYIDLPLLMQYHLSNGMYFSAGPQISFNTSAKQLTEATLDNGKIINIEEDISKQVEDLDYSFPLEVAYAIEKGEGGKQMDLRLRYSYGLNDVFQSNTGFSANQSLLQFILSFHFIED